MRLSTKAMAVSAGLLWGGALLMVGLINLAKPSYGAEFVVIGTVDGVIDGGVAGFLLAWLYNFVGK